MEKIELKDAFAEFKNQKNIDRPTMMGVLEDVFRTQITKTYGSAENFDIIINIDKGDCEIYWNREVVEEVEDPNTEIAINDEALDDDYEIGETFAKKIELKDFGRRGILNIRQNLQGRIRVVSWTSRRLTSTTSTWARSARYSQVRFIRHGRRKSSSLTRMATSSDFLSRSRFLASTSRRTILYAQSSRA